ncbi:YceD family protein [Ectothiorhodospira lacustris]|uniref:YceD family protein n=1 Tax=Ectothiorhodospira lacustris TaxID=2899127 RepID=UPI001EE90A44|nr:YceD family protein [Ectothiorhodospira lacustris]MCG5509368.1 YceD family protein [Ectothiorhodospira lacustris]MCG5521422.1 YceD family protein [Ectothiorhodospira lacustris]
MSDSLLPELVDPFRLADKSRVLDGVLDLTAMERLAEAMGRSAHGLCRVVLCFDRGASGRPRVTGHVVAELAPLCQRCLEPMALPVDTRFEMRLVQEDRHTAGALDEEDVLVVGDERLNLAALVEDELMLCLPVVSLHPLQDCAVRFQPEFSSRDVKAAHKTEENNPFAVLGRLKGEQDGDS